MKQEEPPFKKPYLILCEGRGDVSFLRCLIEKRQIPDHFDIRNSYKNAPAEGGRSTFGRYLSGRLTNESFLSAVKAVLIISDNDVAGVSFNEVLDQLAESNGYPTPASPEVIAIKQGFPRICVYMIPHNVSGNLETVCLGAAYHKWPFEQALDQFVAGTPAQAWASGLQAKMRMQSLLSAINDHQPDTGFGAHWNQAEVYRTPVEHAAFDHIAAFLNGFPGLAGV